MDKQSPRYYEFGPFRLNADERLLLRRNEVMPLTPKLIDTLLVLVENNGHVVTKQALMETLWPDSFVEESSLTQNISLLRKILAARGNGQQQYIETISKRGYRFVASVHESVGVELEVLEQEFTNTEIVIEEHFLHDSVAPISATSDAVATPVSRLGRRTYLMMFAGLVLLISVFAAYVGNWKRSPEVAFTPKSIAVLPFKTIGVDTDSNLMSLGMADSLIIRLSRLEQTSVLPTSSVFKYTAREKDALAIGRDLRVDAILDGTLQRDGNRIRVSAQLLRVGDGKTIWSGKFDEQYESLFALQDSISEQMAAALMPAASHSPEYLANNNLTRNPQAYQAYLNGLYFWNRRTKDNLPRAIQYLEQAVQADPNFALARVFLADCYNLTAWEGNCLTQPELAKKADAEVTRALELNETLAEAHTVKAGIMSGKMDFVAADQHFRRALELNPSYALTHLRYGYFLLWNSKPEEALNHMKRAQDLDPVSPVANTALAYVLMMTRRFDESITSLQRALELQPESTVAHFNLGQAYVQQRRFAEAETEFDKLKDSYPLWFTQGKVYAYAAAGRRGEALRILSRLLRSKDRERISNYDYAILYAAMGDKDAAFGCLEKLIHDRSTTAMLKYDPQLDPLRNDQRFAKYLSARLND
jgi:DNA-binding winged helix-turn-helix (wHTH) protein/TolB-like protein/Tfp pilus assembly protein PilF